MSRTDKDIPNWVRAMRAAHRGAETTDFHSVHCVEDLACDFVMRRVPRDVAEAEGWHLPESWAFLGNDDTVYAEVPTGPFPCDIDTSGGRCTRWYHESGGRFTSTSRPTRDDWRAYYFGPERACVRDALRTAAKEYRGTGEVDVVPQTRQTRHSTWAGGWWD